MEGIHYLKKRKRRLFSRLNNASQELYLVLYRYTHPDVAEPDPQFKKASQSLN